MTMPDQPGLGTPERDDLPMAPPDPEPDPSVDPPAGQDDEPVFTPDPLKGRTHAS